MLGVEVKSDRVVIDRNRITGGGVTAGIDFGLTSAAQLCDEETAKVTVQGGRRKIAQKGDKI